VIRGRATFVGVLVALLAGSLVTAAPSVAAPGEWTPAAPLPVAKTDLGAVSVGGSIYAVGGLDCVPGENFGFDCSFSGSVRVYHPDSNTWTTAAAMPTARAGLGLARGGDGLIYAIGGYDGDGVLRTVEAYDPATDKWSASTPLPDPRRNLAAATGADGKIYVFGWHSDSYGPVSTEIFNPATKTWTSAAGNQCAIDASGAARGPDGRIYVTGFGCTAAFDPGTKSWTKLPDLFPFDNRLAAGLAFSDSGRLFAVGGERRYETGYADAYTKSLNRWVVVPSLQRFRTEQAVVRGPDGMIYAIGGYSDDFETILRSVERLDVSDTTAPTVTTAPTPSLVAGTTVEGGVVPVNVAWSVSADSFVNVLQRSNDGAPYQTMEYAARRFWPAGVKQSLRRPLTGVSYRYRIEPSDAAGNIGTAVAGPAWQVGVVQDSNTSLQYAGGWALGSSPKAFDGSQRYTTTAGASATLQFTGRSVAWITPRSPGRGHARVYVDGELLGAVSTAAKTVESREIAFAHNWPVSGTHTLKIVAVGDHRIDVDAVAVVS